MAVDPAPAITSTVVSGPSWVTAPSAAPAPEMSAAPNSASRMLSVKMMQHGQRNRDRKGRQESRRCAMNQPCSIISRQWKGRRNSAFPVSTQVR